MTNSILGALMLRPTGDYLLSSLMWFLEQEEESLCNLDPDLPIHTMFSETFNYANFLLATALFELHHGIDIPDHLADYNLTLSQFIQKIHSLPKLSNADYFAHLTGAQLALQEGVERTQKGIVEPDETNLAYRHIH